MTTQNEAAERLREDLTPAENLYRLWRQDKYRTTQQAKTFIADALAAERRDFGKRVFANFSDRIDRAWGNENAAKATDLLRWAVDEEAAR